MANREMSNTLKERLKKAGRSFKSPTIVQKHTKKECITSALATDIPTSTIIDDATNGKVYSLPKTPIGIHKSKSSRMSNEKTNKPFKTPSKVSVNQKEHDSLSPFPIASSSTPTLAGIKRLMGSEQETPAKVIHLSDENDSHVHGKNGITVVLKHQNDATPSSSNKEENDIDKSKCLGLKDEKNKLLQRISEKEEIVRKLKMVKVYRSKNNLEELNNLISKWREVSKDAIQDLWSLLDSPKPSITQLLDHYGINHTFVGYNAEDETFS